MRGRILKKNKTTKKKWGIEKLQSRMVDMSTNISAI